MDIITHNKIDQELCGKPLEVEEGFSRIKLKTLAKMAVDKTGLVHGGFIFGLADYAAMIAVNDPHVVLGAADVSFLKPVLAGETLLAEAKLGFKEGKKHMVNVTIKKGDQEVFKGEFTCFVLDKHVLA